MGNYPFHFQKNLLWLQKKKQHFYNTTLKQQIQSEVWKQSAKLILALILVVTHINHWYYSYKKRESPANEKGTCDSGACMKDHCESI